MLMYPEPKPRMVTRELSRVPSPLPPPPPHPKKLDRQPPGHALDRFSAPPNCHSLHQYTTSALLVNPLHTARTPPVHRVGGTPLRGGRPDSL